MPRTVPCDPPSCRSATLALCHQINFGRQETSDGDWFYFVRDPVTLGITDKLMSNT